MSFNRKRDRMQIIADILSSCRRPQTQTYIRRQTTISYSVLQTCIRQLLLRKWLMQSEESCGQKKLAILIRDWFFWKKWAELQGMMEIKNTRKLIVPSPGIQPIMVKSK